MGLTRGSTPAEVKKMRIRMLLFYHPDKNKGYANAGYVFSKVKEAFDIIMGVDETERNNLEPSTDE